MVKKAPIKLENIIVAYINVSKVAPDAIPAFMEKMQAVFAKLQKKLEKQHTEMLFIPVGDGTTRLEAIKL